jgi:hypothetical protein
MNLPTSVAERINKNLVRRSVVEGQSSTLKAMTGKGSYVKNVDGNTALEKRQNASAKFVETNVHCEATRGPNSQLIQATIEPSMKVSLLLSVSPSPPCRSDSSTGTVEAVWTAEMA